VVVIFVFSLAGKKQKRKKGGEREMKLRKKVEEIEEPDKKIEFLLELCLDEVCAVWNDFIGLESLDHLVLWVLHWSHVMVSCHSRSRCLSDIVCCCVNL
jgi:hypothetical protein